MKKDLILPVLFILLMTGCRNNKVTVTDEVFCGHRVALDEMQKIVPWYLPREKAFDHFLHLRWNFILNRVPLSPGPAPRSSYPLYYFYSAFTMKDGIPVQDAWMNDIGEKIPNWFESARLYYAYTGDSTVMNIIKKFAAYTLEHGTGSASFAWPSFPYTTTNSGDTLFRGFTSAGRLALHEVHVDHAGEVGLTWFRLYQYTGDKKYLDAAISIADIISKHAKKGSARESVLPYRVKIDSGRVTAPYGANWTGCYTLLETLVRADKGDTEKYKQAAGLIREFLLEYPMKTGYWTDGHTDTDVNSCTYKSNLSASNMVLCLFDFPELDPEWRKDVPDLIKWTEKNFIFRSAPDEPSTMWGANIVGEQDTFNFKMDYQTARYAAECARWYAASGDEAYRDEALRSLTWVTYCNDSTGVAFESPVSKGILSWWSDCYGECPRMFYQAFAGIPELAPPHENHILYSFAVLTDVLYSDNSVKFSASSGDATEYLRLKFKPRSITVTGKELKRTRDLQTDSYTVKSLGGGDYAVVIRHKQPGKVTVS